MSASVTIRNVLEEKDAISRRGRFLQNQGFIIGRLSHVCPSECSPGELDGRGISLMGNIGATARQATWGEKLKEVLDGHSYHNRFPTYPHVADLVTLHEKWKLRVFGLKYARLMEELATRLASEFNVDIEVLLMEERIALGSSRERYDAFCQSFSGLFE